MNAYQKLQEELRREPRTWLITGAAGFIGSNLVEALLSLDQQVAGLDNLATGCKRNLSEVKGRVTAEQWARFCWLGCDVSEPRNCQVACRGADFVLHQAALGSVPGSISDPIEANNSNVNGFLNLIVAARDNNVRRFVYASSCAVYGDYPDLPSNEHRLGRCLSPYAATKCINELYAEVFARCYGLQSIGLRYFNVFGPRQDPNGAYAAVIPKWIAAMIENKPVYINGDGETSRDFCYIDNVVQANLLAATATDPKAVDQVYNIAVGDRTSLNELFYLLRDRLLPFHPHLKNFNAIYQDFRPGDVRHSEADIAKARQLLGYEPTYKIAEGIDAALAWYRAHLG